MCSMGVVSMFLPQFVTAKALGVSVSKDLIALAFVNDNGLADVEVFAHRASAVFRSAPDDADFRDQINPLQVPGEEGKTIGIEPKRILEPAIEKVAIVGFSSTDLPLASKKLKAVFYDIPNDNTLMKQLLAPGGKMVDDKFLSTMSSGDPGRQLRAEIVRHFYAQVTGKSWNTKGARFDAALAVARGFCALEMARAAKG